MGRNRFVAHKTKRIDISDGDWIEVKEQLNIGETLDVEGAGLEISQAPGEREATYSVSRPGDAAIVRVSVWLTGWSLRNAKGDNVPVSKAAVGQLDKDTFGEIRRALDVHIKAVSALHTDDDPDAKPDKPVVADPVIEAVAEGVTVSVPEAQVSKN